MRIQHLECEGLRSGTPSAAKQLILWSVLVSRRLGCLGRAEQAFDQAFEAGHSLFDASKAVLHLAKAVRNDAERREQHPAQCHADGKYGNQLRAHVLSLAAGPILRELESSRT